MPKTVKAQLDDLNSQLNERRDDALIVTKQWRDIWRQAYNYIYDNQLADMPLKDGFEPVWANYIFPSMMQELALASQRNQIITARPCQGKDSTAAKVWTSHLRWLYETQLKFADHLLRAQLDGKIYGHWISYPYWNPKSIWNDREERWDGEIELSLIRPEYFGADPEAETLTDAKYVFCRRQIDLEEAKARWPHAAPELENAPKGVVDDLSANGVGYGPDSPAPDGQQDQERTPEQYWIGQLVSLINPRPDGSTTQGQAIHRRRVTVEQFLLRDFSENVENRLHEPTKQEMMDAGHLAFHAPSETYVNTKTGQPWEGDRLMEPTTERHATPAYPFGRLILRCNGVILNDKPAEQRWPYRKWPYTVGVNHVLPHVWQGLNNTLQARGLQDWLNISMVHLCNHVKYFGDPQAVVEEGALAGVKTGEAIARKLKAKAGHILVVKKGAMDKVRRERPPEISQGALMLYQQMGKDLRDQTGMQDIGLGHAMRKGTTATEAQDLQTNSRLRQALSNRMCDIFAVDVFEHIAEIAQRMYPPDRWIRVAADGDEDTVAQITSGMKDVRFDIRLMTTTDLPNDIDRDKADMMALFGAVNAVAPGGGMLLLPDIFDAFRMSDKGRTLMKQLPMFQQFTQFLQQQQAAAEAQAKAKAAGGPPAPAPAAAQPGNDTAAGQQPPAAQQQPADQQVPAEMAR
jgi:hypothetical protein